MPTRRYTSPDQADTCPYSNSHFGSFRTLIRPMTEENRSRRCQWDARYVLPAFVPSSFRRHLLKELYHPLSPPSPRWVPRPSFVAASIASPNRAPAGVVGIVPITIVHSGTVEYEMQDRSPLRRSFVGRLYIRFPPTVFGWPTQSAWVRHQPWFLRKTPAGPSFYPP